MNISYKYRYVKSLLQRYGFHGLLMKTMERAASPMLNYTQRYREYLPTEEELSIQRQTSFSYAPLISIVVPAYETPETFLTELIACVLDQTYTNWELCLADGSQTDRVEKLALQAAGKDSRIRYQRLARNGGISENTNAGFEMVRGSYVAMMDHDDLIPANALFEMVRCINEKYEDADRQRVLIYSDEDKISWDGKVHSRPHFKPDYNREFLRHNNYFCHFLLFSAELLMETKGLRSEYDGAQDYDLVLRSIEAGARVIHIPQILYHWRIHEGSTAGNSADKSYAFDHGCKAIEDHLRRIHTPGSAEVTTNLGVYSVRYRLKGTYAVTIAYSDQNQMEDLKKVYGSHYSLEEEDSRVTLELTYIKKEQLQTSPMTEIEGEYLLLLEHGVRIAASGLIETLLRYTQQPEYGMVGARVFDHKKRIASCGTYYDQHGSLVQSCAGLPGSYKGYFLHAVIPQNVSVLPMECVLLKKEAYQVLAQSPSDLVGTFRDADQCLTLRAAGFEIVMTPEVSVISSRKDLTQIPSKEELIRQKVQQKSLRRKWQTDLKILDPAYNPNLSFRAGRTYTMKPRIKDVFIIGSKGIPAKYGGFESFVEHLTRGRKSQGIKYHVACLADKNSESEYQGAHCFGLKVPRIGAAKAIVYDIQAFLYSLKYIRSHGCEEAAVYVLACRIGPFIGILNHFLKKSGSVLYVNPDGHEWMRGKWNPLVRKYWKFSEKLMVKHADMLICDSKNIETYIRREYAQFYPITTFIAYGAQIEKSSLSSEDEELLEWYRKNQIDPDAYYLIVGRFVPENNYECMIREFMQADTACRLVIISNVEENSFFQKLKERTGFERDERICFAGTVYDEERIKKIREQARGYLHGHEVGGTNPSLLEALGSTKVNLLLDVGFNREVGEDAALYWTKEKGNLASLIEMADHLTQQEREELGSLAKARIREYYSHERINAAYEELFLR